MTKTDLKKTIVYTHSGLDMLGKERKNKKQCRKK